MYCPFEVKKKRGELISQICAWVSAHCMFGGRHLNCEEVRHHLESVSIEELELVVRVLYCEG